MADDSAIHSAPKPRAPGTKRSRDQEIKCRVTRAGKWLRSGLATVGYAAASAASATASDAAGCCCWLLLRPVRDRRGKRGNGIPPEGARGAVFFTGVLSRVRLLANASLLRQAVMSVLRRRPETKPVCRSGQTTNEPKSSGRIAESPLVSLLLLCPGRASRKRLSA